MSFQTSLRSLLLATFTEEFAIRGTHTRLQEMANYVVKSSLQFARNLVESENIKFHILLLLVAPSRYLGLKM